MVQISPLLSLLSSTEASVSLQHFYHYSKLIFATGQLQKMGILPSKSQKPATGNGKRRSTQLDFSNLAPLKKTGTVGFSTFRDNEPRSKSRKKSNGNVNAMAEDSDEDDDDAEIVGKMEDVDEKDDKLL